MLSDDLTSSGFSAVILAAITWPLGLGSIKGLNRKKKPSKKQHNSTLHFPFKLLYKQDLVVTSVTHLLGKLYRSCFIISLSIQTTYVFNLIQWNTHGNLREHHYDGSDIFREVYVTYICSIPVTEPPVNWCQRSFRYKDVQPLKRSRTKNELLHEIGLF